MQRRDRKIPRIPTFYVDDSTCMIGGISHTLLGGITFEDELHALASFIEIKQKLGIRPEEEIKWNSSKFTAEERHFISQSVLPILSETTGFLIICKNGKQSAALQVGLQFSDFCRHSNCSGFLVRFDNDIVQNRAEFDQHVYRHVPSCYGWTTVDSAHDQLIQYADLFIGFQKLRLEFGLETKDRKKEAEFNIYGNQEPQSVPLEWYVRTMMRHSLWGVMQEPPEAQMKKNLGYGVRVFSNVPSDTMEKALTYLDHDYLGCIH